MIVHGRYRSQAPSGENRVVDQEAALLASAGHTVERFERHSDDIASWSAARRAALVVTSVRSREVRRALEDRLATVRPDVVHVHNTFPTLSPSVLLACRDLGVPVVATLHNYKLLCASGDFFRDGRPCHACADGALLPAVRHGCYRGASATTAPVSLGLAVNRGTWRDLVSAYVFISESQRRLMSGLDLPVDRTFVKHNFVDPAPPRTGPTDHAVAYVGRLDEAKGVRFLMEAWEQFGRAHPRSGLVLRIVGAGPLSAEVEAWARHRPSVDLVGQVAPEQARRLLGGAAAVVVPSAWEETFGLVAVEAMAAGVPPIAPARGSFPELVTPGVDGVLFRPGEAASLAASFEQLDRSPGTFADLGRAGLRTWHRRFRPGVGLDRLEEVYRFVRENPRLLPAEVAALPNAGYAPAGTTAGRSRRS
ncbi:glycosyltransferase [Nocardioides sp. TF02-7]|uniref:glycosyltransferase n=1 Tax=Nocardioides sp. TF02-7 TaxID=2917724 RepID=UPI001F05AAF5|nr:glycosyltransferase [Nocardioides sp. TF02-7]UMG94842.1 glycosyltransferase [Nocardioides sp. TF02-7]